MLRFFRRVMGVKMTSPPSTTSCCPSLSSFSPILLPQAHHRLSSAPCSLLLCGTPGGQTTSRDSSQLKEALRVLKSANLILSEDTRHSGKLLQHHNIKTPLLSYHKFNESQQGTLILQKLQHGEIIALISDAGTPGISDPGEQLFWRGTLGEAKEAFSSYQPKGEITILVEEKGDSAAEVPSEAEVAHELRELVSNGHSLSMAVKKVSESTTVKRKSVYSLALKIFGDKTELPKQISSEKDQHSERYSLRHSVSECHVDAAVADKLLIRTWSCYPRFLLAFLSLKIQREASQSSMLMDKKGDVLRMDLLMVPTSNHMRLRWTSVTVRSPCPMGRTTPCVNQNWIFCLGTIPSPISANVRLQQASNLYSYHTVALLITRQSVSALRRWVLAHFGQVGQRLSLVPDQPEPSCLHASRRFFPSVKSTEEESSTQVGDGKK